METLSGSSDREALKEEKGQVVITQFGISWEKKGAPVKVILFKNIWSIRQTIVFLGPQRHVKIAFLVNCPDFSLLMCP
jgi:hypothetical protein